MRHPARVIKTAISVIAGAICGGLAGLFTPVFLLALFDWINKAGSGNQMSSVSWILVIFTVPIGALAFAVLCGCATWNLLDESKPEDGSEPRRLNHVSRSQAKRGST